MGFRNINIYFFVLCKMVKLNDSKIIFLIFIHGLQKTQKKKQFFYVLWLGTNVGQSFEPIITRLFTIGSEFSRLTSYWLSFFDFYPGTSKNSFKMTCFWYPVLFWHFLKSLGKNRKKWANKTEAVRILNQMQKNAW